MPRAAYRSEAKSVGTHSISLIIHSDAVDYRMVHVKQNKPRPSHSTLTVVLSMQFRVLFFKI